MLLISITLFLTIQVKGTDTCYLSGTFNGATEGVIYLYNIKDDAIVDSVLLKNGRFNISVTTNGVNEMILIVQPGTWSCKVMVFKGKTELFIDTTHAHHYDNGKQRWSLIFNVQQTGWANCIYQNYRVTSNIEFFEKLFLYHNTLIEQSYSKYFKDSVYRLNENLQKKIADTSLNWIKKYISDNPKSDMGGYLLNKHIEIFQAVTGVNRVIELLQLIDSSLINTAAYLSVKEFIEQYQNRDVGSSLPNYKLVSENGDSILLTSFKNKITLLDFWASWCVPCRSAIPKLKNVYAKYKKNGFEIVSISTDNSKDAWQKALIKEKMQWLNLLDNTDKNIRLSNALGIVSLPFYILLNNDGKIIFSTDKTEIMIEHIQLLLGK